MGQKDKGQLMSPDTDKNQFCRIVELISESKFLHLLTIIPFGL